ncbi:uncharacterized protein si:dkey-29h14.10 [Colossoma macropomum]|uniref:uncharacterized protein si:dkey-29h14.10 n=1 Tax=Colossoma macropomum TaxID=42526 RepID=UPI001864B0DF|nr:uncharacterized protein si:dkey-29h14.10 [Colossoma macropomum]
MDTTVSDRCMAATPDKTLRRQLGTLSKCMSASLVGRISTCLCRSRILTEYEVQLIQTQGTDTQKASQLLLTVLRKGSRACQLFFKCLAVCSPSLFETVTGCTVRAADVDHYHFEDDNCSETNGAVPPYIINIHNSSLTNCIIGNNNDLCCLLSRTDVTNDKLEDMQRPDQQMVAQDPTEAPSIQVQSSHVEYVIIGDNNYMSIGSNEESGEQEQRESELEDSEG